MHVDAFSLTIYSLFLAHFLRILLVYHYFSDWCLSVCMCLFICLYIRVDMRDVDGCTAGTLCRPIYFNEFEVECRRLLRVVDGGCMGRHPCSV